MNKRLSVFLLLFCFICPVASFGEEHPGAGCREVQKEPQAEGSGHEKDSDPGMIPIDELLKQTCEHKMPQIDCDECRYELGAVKVPATSTTLIKVESLETTPEENMIEVNGELSYDDNHLRCVTPRFSGRLASISARVGDFVREGQPLLVIESPELAQAAIELLKRQAEFDLAKRKLERETMLREKKISSEQDLQEAQSNKSLAEIELDNARRKLALFGFSESRIAGLATNKKDSIFRGEMPIASPLGGRVITRAGSVGDMVTGEKEIFQLADMRHLWGIAQIHERNMADVLKVLKEGSIKVEVKVEALPDRTFVGSIFGADPRISPETRTLPVRMQIENHDETLRPGMFIKVKVFLGDTRKLPTLPAKAIMVDEGRSFVFVKHGDSLFFRRNIVSGNRIGDRIPIIKGIKAGDEVVTEGAFLLKSDVLREKMGAGCAD